MFIVALGLRRQQSENARVKDLPIRAACCCSVLRQAAVYQARDVGKDEELCGLLVGAKGNRTPDLSYVVGAARAGKSLGFLRFSGDGRSQIDPNYREQTVKVWMVV
jgi:hypothetical protein